MSRYDPDPAGSGPVIQDYESKDPGPDTTENFTDLQLRENILIR
jgi:hypothetical protein